MQVITIIIVFILLIISYEDFTSRLIHWYYFPIVAVLLFVQLIQTNHFYTWVSNIGVNLLIVLFMLLMTTIIYSVRRGKIVTILDNAIGTADVLIFGILCIILSPVNLVLFLLLSFIVALLFQLFTFPFTKENHKYIPLAGIVSVMLSIALVVQDRFAFIDLTDDYQTLGVIGHYYF